MVTSKKRIRSKRFSIAKIRNLKYINYFPLVNDNERSNAITFNLRKNSNI